jgi:putative membrane protein insertion efficiency factor
MTRVRRWLWAAGAPARFVALLPVRLYRVSVGQAVGGRCRFHPSCSDYAERAIREVGAVRGSALALWRVLRCSPLSRGGVDYPPRVSRPVYEGVIRSGDAA